MDAKQLNELKDRIKFSLANRNSNKFYETAAVAALKGVEIVGERVGAKIGGIDSKGTGGLADSCNRNPEFHDLLDEIFMEYNIFNCVGPEKRLLMLVIQTGLMVHGTKTALENMTPEQKETVMKQVYASRGLQVPAQQPIQVSQPVQVQQPVQPTGSEPKTEWTIRTNYSDLLKQ